MDFVREQTSSLWTSPYHHVQFRGGTDHRQDAIESTPNAAVLYTLAIGKTTDTFSDENQFIADKVGTNGTSHVAAETD